MITSETLILSNRSRNTPASPIRKLSPLATRAKAEGKTVYHLNIGQPDIPSPKEFFEGLKSYSVKVLAYEDSRGLPQLREAWSGYFNRSSAVSTTADNFLITTGASEALIFSFMIACDSDDEIVVFDPSYANYMSFAAIAGVKLIPVRCEIGNSFALPDRLAIDSRISHRTRAILLCNPNNPTGAVYSRADLELLLSICRERNLYLLVDEAYREFVFDGLKPISILEVAGDDPHIVVIDSLSKRFSLCGGRLGAIITTNQDFYKGCYAVAQARLASPTLEQHAAAYMLERISPSFVSQQVAEYEHRRNVLFESLSKLDGVVVANPRGAFYAVAQLPVDDAERFASFMLAEFAFENQTTFIAPAQGFYMEAGRGQREARIAYVLNTSDIEKAVFVLGKGLEAYSQRR